MIPAFISNIHQNKAFASFAMPCLCISWALGYFYLGDFILLANGTGYDGSIYADLAQNFLERLKNQDIENYYLQRILPSVIIFSVFSVFEIAKAIPNIIIGFYCLNTVSIALSCFLWSEIAQKMQFSKKTTWLVFGLGVLNFGFIKIPFYYAVLTDYFVFFLGFLLLYFHIINSLIGKCIVILAGIFSWNSFGIFGFLSLIFPNRTKNISQKYFQNIPNIAFGNYPLAFLLLLPIGYKIFSVIYLHQNLSNSINSVYVVYLYIGGLASLGVGVYLWACILPMWTSMRAFFIEIWTQIYWRGVLASLFLQGIATSFILYFGTKTPINWENMYRNLSTAGIEKPFLVFSEGFLYFGVLFCFLLFQLKKIVRISWQWNLGVYAGLALATGLKFVPESRLIMNFIPFLWVLVGFYIEKNKISRQKWLFIFAINLIFSKFYLSLNSLEKVEPNFWYFQSTFGIPLKEHFFIFIALCIVLAVYLIIFKTKKHENLPK